LHIAKLRINSSVFTNVFFVHPSIPNPYFMMSKNTFHPFYLSLFEFKGI
jgi:hypothetical protein